jgi:hypothetical protein
MDKLADRRKRMTAQIEAVCRKTRRQGDWETRRAMADADGRILFFRQNRFGKKIFPVFFQYAPPDMALVRN